MLAFKRRVRHPFYPSVKPAPAAAAKGLAPALYGAYEELSMAADAGARVARAVFPIRRAASPFLTDSERDSLWRMFEVPVYTLLVDPRGNVVGYECEAQDGIHIREDYAAGLLFAEIESRLCECGRPGPRLMPARLEQKALAAG